MTIEIISPITDLLPALPQSCMCTWYLHLSITIPAIPATLHQYLPYLHHLPCADTRWVSITFSTFSYLFFPRHLLLVRHLYKQVLHPASLLPQLLPLHLPWYLCIHLLLPGKQFLSLHFLILSLLSLVPGYQYSLSLSGLYSSHCSSSPTTSLTPGSWWCWCSGTGPLLSFSLFFPSWEDLFSNY